MKTIQLIIAAGFLFFSSLTFAATPITDFAGEWINVDEDTRGLTRMVVTIKGGQPYVHAFGSCSPRDCDWETKKGTYFFTAGHHFISVNYKFEDKGITKQIVMRKEGEKIIAKVHSTYQDSRKPTTYYYTMKASKPSVYDFRGNWVNVDNNTRGVTKLNITINSGRASVHAFGSCSPADCDWGSVFGSFYLAAGHHFISANYKSEGGLTKQVIMRIEGDTMIVKVYATYPDSRKPRTSFYKMKRA